MDSKVLYLQYYNRPPMFNIALNTFRELARNKILYVIVFFGIALIGFSLVLATLSLGQSDKIVTDF